MKLISKRSVETYYQGRLQITPEAIQVAKESVQRLWDERRRERELEPTDDRSGSCKFAALLARDLFGGRLAGNNDHVFVLLRDGTRLDLNEDQRDVMELGDRAHRLECDVLSTFDYREALGSCTERTRRWVAWAEEQLAGHPKPTPPLSTKARLALVRDALGIGEHKISHNKVPYLLVGSHISVAWFGTNQHYRVFDGYGRAGDQNRYDFDTPEAAAEFIKNMIHKKAMTNSLDEQTPTIEMPR